MVTGKKFINFSIRKFMIRNDVDLTESEVAAIMKRLDTDRDLRVSFTEFKKLFTFPSSGKDLSSSSGFKSLTKSTFYDSKTLTRDYDSPIKKAASPNRYYSPLRASKVASPLRSSIRSPVRSPVRKTPIKSKSPLKTSCLTKSIDRSNLGQSHNFEKSYYPSYPSYEEENFLNYLRDVINIENEIERTKSDLVLKSDFNVEDAFRIFELEGRGYLTDLDLKYGFNALDLYPTSEEISLFIKRYDPRNEGVITFSNFFEVVAPVDREYRRMLEVRLPVSYHSRINKTDVFLPSTKLYLQNLLSLILKSEGRVEGWRQRLTKMPRFNTRIFFEKLDRLDKAYFDETDVNFY
jgi:Ca2+-binding EF-hand superfamily protein